MNLLDFVFRLGVVFAIYGFLWGLIEIGFFMLSQGRKRSVGEVYFIKAIKYFFLVDVTFLFCLHGESSKMVILNQVVFAGIILLTYFVGKLQKNQNKSMFAKFAGTGIPMQKQALFNMTAEIIVILIALATFALFWFFPEYATNPISHWFHDSIINIEDTPIFGFIFKIIGFFFLMNLIFKMIGAFTFLLSGGKTGPPGMNNDDQNNDDRFDDYEELN